MSGSVKIAETALEHTRSNGPLTLTTGTAEISNASALGWKPCKRHKVQNLQQQQRKCYQFENGFKYRRILQTAPKLVPAAKRRLMPGEKSHQPPGSKGCKLSGRANVHHVRRVVVVQQRVRPHKLHVHRKLQESQSQGYHGSSHKHAHETTKDIPPRAACRKSH